MVVSWNRGTPKSPSQVEFSLINQPFGGTPMDGTPYISSLEVVVVRASKLDRASCRVAGHILESIN